MRGQLFDTRLSSLSWTQDQWNWNRGAVINYFSSNYVWGGSGTDNNGNITRQQHWVPTDDSLTNYWYSQDNYFYDTLNRLTLTNEIHGGPWGQSGQDFAQGYTYDRYGNRTIDQAATTTNVPRPNYTIDPNNTNRLIAPAGFNYSYDAAGNQTNDTYTGQGSRTYDAENHLKTAQGNGQTQTYTYDADGQRTRRNVNGVETWQVYGFGGELLAEYKSGAAPFLPTREYGYRGGQLLVTISSGDDARLSRFVYNLYYGALQRDPTSQELQDKVNQLAAAGVQGQSQLLTTAKQIARSLFIATAFETSPYRSDVQYVTDLYYTYLQRGPDSGGLGWWVSQVPGSGRENVLNAFEASSEFSTIVSTLYGTAISDNQRTENFVNNFYLGALGRFPTPTELQQQRDALNAAATQGVSQVQTEAENFGRWLFAAQINDASLSNTQYVTNLYEGFLQRGPDAGGLGWWSSQATLGQGRQNVLDAFAVCIPFRDLSATLYREAFWLVPDRLGTPRMIVSKAGTLAGVKRHDYLPFGEELTGGIGGRTSAQGFTADSVRQKFTGYEADAETGLNFAPARYQSSVQGRFTSVDPLGTSAGVTEPQSLNRYSYVLNSPVNLIDPDGMMPRASTSWGDVAGMFWGSSFDFGTPHPSRGQYIIAAAGYFRDILVANKIAGNQVEAYIRKNNFAAAAAILRRNPDVGLRVKGFKADLWGELGAAFLDGYGPYTQVASMRGEGLRGALRRGWRSVITLLSKRRGPDFQIFNASAGGGIQKFAPVGEPLFDTIHGFEIGADAGAYYAVGWIIQLEKPTRQEVMDFGKGLDYSTDAYLGFGFTLICNIGFPPTNGIAFGFGFAGGNSYGISDTLSAYQNAERLWQKMMGFPWAR